MNQINKSHFSLSAFGREIEAESARSLDLLRDIDATISSLNRLTAQLNSDLKFSENAINSIDSLDAIIDQDNNISSQLEKAQSSINSLYDVLISKREAGRNDDRLTDDDGIEDAYNEAIAAAADLHNSLNTLRWAIGEHDADMSPVSKSHSNMDDLIKELSS